MRKFLPGVSVAVSAEAAEREAKSFDGIYIGTVAGTFSERATMAYAIQHMIDQFAARVGKTHHYCDVSVSVEIRGGRVAESRLSCLQTLRPVKDAAGAANPNNVGKA